MKVFQEHSQSHLSAQKWMLLLAIHRSTSNKNIFQQQSPNKRFFNKRRTKAIRDELN